MSFDITIPGGQSRRLLTGGKYCPDDIVVTVTGIESLSEYSQTNPIVAQYMAEVSYPTGDYSESKVLPYIYAETDYPMGYPMGYDVAVQQAGVLHRVDSVAVIQAPSVVGTNTLYNAIPGEVAHWWHTVDDNVTQCGTIRPTGRVRMIQTTAKNVRDLGGWASDGGKIRYGKLFRGGLLDVSDRAVLVDQLKIRHDLDLRGKGDNGGLTESPLGTDVSYTCTESHVWYSLQREDEWRTILCTIFNAAAKDEPVIFHCAAGADRTGTVACIVETILGVSQPDLDKDFELTSFAIAPNARRRTDDGWKNLITEITSISVGATLRDKVINWVGYLGFTAAEINAFRKAMIDGTPGDIVIEEYMPEEPEIPAVNYFDASKAELNKRIGSSGTLSDYNGMVVSDFIPVDKSMENVPFAVSGVIPTKSSAYNYYVRTYFYDSNTKSPFGTSCANSYLDWSGTAITAWDSDIAADTAYIRIAFVIKDNVAITADDIANIKITLE